MTGLGSALSSFAHSSVANELKSAIPTVIALSAGGLSPAVAVGVAAASNALVDSTVTISDAGKQLANAGTSVLGDLEAVGSSIGSGIYAVENDLETAVKKAYGAVAHVLSSVVSGVEDAGSAVEGVISSIANPVTFGLASLAGAFGLK